MRRVNAKLQMEQTRWQTGMSAPPSNGDALPVGWRGSTMPAAGLRDEDLHEIFARAAAAAGDLFTGLCLAEFARRSTTAGQISSCDGSRKPLRSRASHARFRSARGNERLWPDRLLRRAAGNV